jgi:glycosyltransferase involved in cell wall biosynthesis
VAERLLRVLLVSAYFRPHVGGVERFVELLAEGLGMRGHDVTVLCCRTDADAPLAEEAAGYRVERVPAMNPAERRLGVPYPVPSPLALRRALQRSLGSVDVVHVQDVLYATSVAALRAARRAAVPAVVTHHVGFVPQSNAALDVVEWAAVRAAAPVARLATKSVAYNPDVRDWVERTWRVPEVELAPIGVRTAGSTAERRAFGLPEDRFLALFVGRDVAKKRLDLVFEAADPAYDVVVVSDTRRAPKPGVRILRPMPAPRLSELMRCVDAFVLPSRDEGLPLALQEAMAAGLPVVTTISPGYRRYFTADDVLPIEPTAESVHSALLDLARDSRLRERLGRRSLEVAREHFGEDAFVAAYERLYQQLLTL